MQRRERRWRTESGDVVGQHVNYSNYGVRKRCTGNVVKGESGDVVGQLMQEGGKGMEGGRGEDRVC